ncbi:MAG: siphovirus ReqiPepy6 Gp37-like family protein [Lachnospiraceae bacterium]|nr:siphovirus ReqiPepy6 Gp37-like family protein [Lachnospiraceae bacterium]
MELYILDQNLDIQGIISNFVSLEWQRKLAEPGQFQVLFDYSDDVAEIVQLGALIYNTDEDEPGIITRLSKEIDAKGNEVINAKGYMAGRYLYQRIINTREILSGTPQSIIRTLASHHAISPSASARAIPKLYLGIDTSAVTEVVAYQAEYTNLAKTIGDIASAYEMGWKIRLDIAEKKMYLDTWTGTDRTIDSETPCLFSTDFGTVLTQRYYRDVSNYATYCICATGKDDDKIVQDVGGGSGLDRYEIFATASGVNKKDQTVSQIKAQLSVSGKEKLAKYPGTEGFESKVDFTNAGIFSLGDYVTCENKKWGVRKDMQIKTIRRNIRSGKDETIVTFGDEVQTLTSLIKAKE